MSIHLSQTHAHRYKSIHIHDNIIQHIQMMGKKPLKDQTNTCYNKLSKIENIVKIVESTVDQV